MLIYLIKEAFASQWNIMNKWNDEVWGKNIRLIDFLNPLCQIRFYSQWKCYANVDNQKVYYIVTILPQHAPQLAWKAAIKN